MREAAVFEVFHRVRVAWNQVDKAGIVHFSNYLKYMEEAEASLFRELSGGDLGAVWGGDPGGLAWVRLGVNLEFRNPAGLDDQLLVHLWVAEKKSRSLELGARISLRERIIAQGRIRTAPVRMGQAGRMSVCRIPAKLDQSLGVAPWGRDWPEE